MLIGGQILTAEEAREIENIRKNCLVGKHARVLASKANEK